VNARLRLLLFALSGSVACQEKLATPTDCPELCPGTSLVIRDTVLTARFGLDSTYTGYLAADQVGALLVSNGLDAGEARAFAVFPARSDSVTVDGVRVTYTIDSIGFAFSLLGRDTAARSVRLIIHRITPTVDTTTSFAAIDGALTPESLIDSVLVSDTLKSGTITVIVKGEALDRILPSEEDSLRLGIGVRVNASVATGVRLGSPSSSANAPVFITYVHAAVADTGKQRQVIALGADLSNYVIEAPPLGADRLFLGGRSGSRLLLRFLLPSVIKDSAGLVRATLELTPAEPVKGLPNDPGELQIRAALIDLGAKSPAVAGVGASFPLKAGESQVQLIDMRTVATLWLGTTGLPATILLGLAPEGGTFTRPEFLSTLSGAGAPRLRITYALSTHPGNP
jgi:hypothetical protein